MLPRWHLKWLHQFFMVTVERYYIPLTVGGEAEGYLMGVLFILCISY